MITPQDDRTTPAARRTRVAVGSLNPVKIAAARTVFDALLGDVVIEGLAVASGVADQPWGDDETIRGARTRAMRAIEATGADYGVGLEGGVVENEDGSVRTCAWAVVVSRDGRSGVGGSLAMPLPGIVADRVRKGEELGHVMDALTGTHGVKHGSGAVGILTRGLVDRQRAYEALVAYAMAPFVASDTFPSAP